MNAGPMKTDFERLLSAEEDKLIDLGRRLYIIEAFQAELHRVTRGKPFTIWNDVVWTMVLDCRDAFVTHFASWIRGMYEKGGFLRQIQAHHLKDLRRRWKAGTAVRPERWINELLSGNHSESFGRVFPEVKTTFPKPDDIEALRDRFITSFNPVVGDRDSNRAHVYEKTHAKNAKMLDLNELRIAMSQAEAFLNDLRLVGCGSTFGYRDMNIAPVDIVAKDLVDTILIGSEPRWSAVLGGRAPEDFYEERHRNHDRLTMDPRPRFNDNWSDGAV